MATPIPPTAAPSPSPVTTAPAAVVTPVVPAPITPAEPTRPTPPLSSAEVALRSDDETFASTYGIADIVTPKKVEAKETPTLEAALERAEDAPAEGLDAPPGWTQDANGKWHTADGKFAPISAEQANRELIGEDEDGNDLEAPAVQPAAAPVPFAAADTPAPPAAPGGAATKPPPPLATEFQISQGGEEVEVPRDLLLTFKANGKVYENVPLDRVVRAAQLGYHNDERERSLAERETRHRDLETLAKDAYDRAQYMEGEYQKLFDDEAYYFRAQEAFREQQQPEAQLARVTAELNATRAQAQQIQARARDEQFFNHVAPRLESLGKTNSLVTPDEIWQQFERLTQPALRQGRIAPENFQTVAQLVDGALADYVTSLQDSRQYAKTIEATSQAELKKEKGQVMLAKRQAARALAPTGGVNASPSRGNAATPKKPAPLARAEAVNDAILERAMAEMNTG